MGWINTLLDVTNVAIGVSNYTQLQQLKQQGQNAAAIQALLAAMRDEIFKFRQAAKDVLDHEYVSPLVPAVAMRMLEIRLEASPITPDLFADLNDKEYVAETYRFIHKGTTHFMNELPSSETTQVNTAAEKSLELADYTFYVKNYQEGRKLREATKTFKELNKRTTTSSQSKAWGMGCLAYLAIIVIVFGLFVDSNPELTTPMVVLASFAFIVWIFAWKGTGRLNEAKYIIEQYGDQIDLDRYNKLDRRFMGDFNHAKTLQHETKQWLDRFFSGDTHIDYQTEDVVELKSLPAQNLENPAAIEEPSSIPFSSQLTSVEQSETSISLEELTPDEQSEVEQPVYQENSEEHIAVEETEDSEVSIPTAQTTIVTPYQTRFCMMCGTKIPDGAIFCPKCGEKLV